MWLSDQGSHKVAAQHYHDLRINAFTEWGRVRRMTCSGMLAADEM